MINSSLCQDGIHGSAAKKKVTIKRDANGTQLEDFSDDGEGQKKPKIISPRRQKYEGQFEKFLVQKYVEEAVKKQSEPIKDLGQFDTVTKLTDSLNVKVQKKMKDREEKAKRKKSVKKEAKTLYEIEENLEKTLTEEATINLGQEVVDKFRTIFESLKEKPDGNEEQ